MDNNKDLEELEALFDNDEFGDDFETKEETISTAVIDENNTRDELLHQDENAGSLEAEYERLQKQLQLLQAKMKNQNSNKLPSSEETVTSKPNGESKISFFDAFQSTLNGSPTKGSSELSPVSHETPPKLKSVLKPSCSGNKRLIDEPPVQKKRRIGHEPKDATECLGQKSTRPVAPNRFFNQQPNITQPKKDKSFNQKNFEIETFSRIRLKQRYIPASELKQRMENKTHLRLSLLRPTMKLSESTDWVTIAVVAKQLDPQTAKNGKMFSIWHLTDLDDCTKHVAFFLFGQVHEVLWRNITVGTVIGLLNPSIMPPKKDDSNSGKYDNTPALTVDVAERVMKIGVSADLGWCTSTKYRNKQPAGKCLAFINKQFGEACIFHLQSKYRRMSSKRGELQASVSGPIATKYKNTLWNKVKGDQFFYGGQTFSAAPPSCNPNIQRKESKMKLTNIVTALNSSTSEVKKEQVERSKTMQAIGGIKHEQVVTGCSETFADLLASGDMPAGSRQFLNHLQKKQNIAVDTPKTTVPRVSPATFLKQRQQFLQQRKASQPTQPGKPAITKVQAPSKAHVTSVSACDIKKATEKMVKMKKQRFLEGRRQSKGPAKQANNSVPNTRTPDLSVVPKLGSDANAGGEIDLIGDWLSTKKMPVLSSTTNTLSTLAELRKRKVIAKLKAENGKVKISKPNPNHTGIGKVEVVKNNIKLQEKIKKKVSNNRKDLDVNAKENNVSETKSLSVLGNKKLSKEEFDRILNATSSHTGEMELEEMERQEEYFNPLIQKEMMEEKMANTMEVPSKVVTCHQCDYTFWAAHDRCKELHHTLQWKNVKKRFFECTNCKQRTTSWEPYPTRCCRDCGSEKTWKRSCMLKAKSVKLDSEVLLLRGVEYSKFLNAMR